MMRGIEWDCVLVAVRYRVYTVACRPVRQQPCIGHREPYIGDMLPSAEGQLEKEAMFPNKSGAYWALMTGPASR